MCPNDLLNTSLTRDEVRYLAEIFHQLVSFRYDEDDNDDDDDIAHYIMDFIIAYVCYFNFLSVSQLKLSLLHKLTHLYLTSYQAEVK